MNHYGALRSAPDPNPPLYKPPRTRASLPAAFSVESRFGEVGNQGNRNACVPYATMALADFARGRLGLPRFDISNSFAYYNALVQDVQAVWRPGIKLRDAGTSIRTVLNMTARQGVCRESTWRSDFPFSKQPDRRAYLEAFHHTLNGYSTLSEARDVSGLRYDLDLLKGCIASGNAFVFAFVITDKLRLNNFTLVAPSQPWGADVESHAGVAVGYDDARQAFRVRNSYGAGWGDKGYFWLPFALALNPSYAYDFWTIEAFWELPA